MKNLILAIIIINTLVACAPTKTKAVKDEKKLAEVEFHGAEIEPYKIDGKQVSRSKHVVVLKPGRHTADVYLSWGGYGRSNTSKQVCFNAKAGEKYLIGADIGIENDKWYNSDWEPYVERVTRDSLFSRFLSAGFIRNLQSCD